MARPTKITRTPPSATPRPDAAALVKAATEARENAYAPYSKFNVGAALRTADGTVITGCNVESASYGATICAERGAIARAVAEGHRSFDAVAIVTGTSPPSPPCGICLQTLAEFAEDMEVILANTSGESLSLHLKDLMPVRFRKEVLAGA